MPPKNLVITPFSFAYIHITAVSAITSATFFAALHQDLAPDDFKKLVDTAHGMGLRVIIDPFTLTPPKTKSKVWGNFAGDPTQYFANKSTPGMWIRDYSITASQKFCIFALSLVADEYHIDGFRFDGVTSMIYHFIHGLRKSSISYDGHFRDNVDKDALPAYLRLANETIHTGPP